MKQISFPIILSKGVGSDSQCLSPLRLSSQSLTVHYNCAIKIKKGVFKIFIVCLVQNR